MLILICHRSDKKKPSKSVFGMFKAKSNKDKAPSKDKKVPAPCPRLDLLTFIRRSSAPLLLCSSLLLLSHAHCLLRDKGASKDRKVEIEVVTINTSSLPLRHSLSHLSSFGRTTSLLPQHHIVSPTSSAALTPTPCCTGCGRHTHTAYLWHIRRLQEEEQRIFRGGQHRHTSR